MSSFKEVITDQSKYFQKEEYLNNQSVNDYKSKNDTFDKSSDIKSGILSNQSNEILLQPDAIFSNIMDKVRLTSTEFPTKIENFSINKQVIPNKISLFENEKININIHFTQNVSINNTNNINVIKETLLENNSESNNEENINKNIEMKSTIIPEIKAELKEPSLFDNLIKNIQYIKNQIKIPNNLLTSIILNKRNNSTLKNNLGNETIDDYKIQLLNLVNDKQLLISEYNDIKFLKNPLLITDETKKTIKGNFDSIKKNEIYEQIKQTTNNEIEKTRIYERIRTNEINLQFQTIKGNEFKKLLDDIFSDL